MSGMAKDQTLAPGETPVITLHPHWKVLVGPVAKDTNSWPFWAIEM